MFIATDTVDDVYEFVATSEGDEDLVDAVELSAEDSDHELLDYSIWNRFLEDPLLLSAEAADFVDVVIVLEATDTVELDEDSESEQIGYSMIEALSISDSATAPGTFDLSLVETLVLRSPRAFSTLDFETYVINTKTGGISRYKWPTFTSLAASPDRQFATMYDGLYELTGNTDSGVDIDAYITTGQINVGNPQKKRVFATYVGLTTNGKMRFKVYADNQEWSYDLVVTRDYDDGSQHETARATLGRGLRARYWTFEVQNDGGANFEISHVHAMIVSLDRRVR